MVVPHGGVDEGGEGGENGEGGDSCGSGGGLGEGTPHTSSKSNIHPVPAVQPPASSAAVQSLAPAARQMASAWAKVWLRVHGQPAFDAPHTEQPGFGDPQAGESLTLEQHRTWPRVGGRGERTHREHMHVMGWVACKRAPRAARSGP